MNRKFNRLKTPALQAEVRDERLEAQGEIAENRDNLQARLLSLRQMVQVFISGVPESQI